MRFGAIIVILLTEREMFDTINANEDEVRRGKMAEFKIENDVLIRYLGKKKNVNVPTSVHTVGRYAFGGCENLEKVVIPEGVTAIEEGAFMKCFYLREIVIPESVTKIGARAFADCRRLQEVSLIGVETIEEWAFDRCDGLIRVTLGNHVKTIENHAFFDCYSLGEIGIPRSVEHIGKDVFGLCPHLTLSVFENSDAELYAIENDINFQNI